MLEKPAYYVTATVCGAAIVTLLCGYYAYNHKKKRDLLTKCEKRFMQLIRNAITRTHSLDQVYKLETNCKEYFMDQIDAAERHLDNGCTDKAIDHILKAMAVCSKPLTLIECLAQSLPYEVSKELLERLMKLLW